MKEDNCCFPDWVKKTIDNGLHSNIYEPILYNHVLTFHFAITSSSHSLSDLNFDSRPHGCNKAKSAAPVILQSSQKVWIEFDKSLGLVDLMNLILILSHLNTIQERDLYLSYFVRKNYDVGMVRTFTDGFCSNFV